MNDLSHWRLCSELSVNQAALLIAGYDPESYRDVYEVPEPPRGFRAAVAALKNAILDGKLAANIRHRGEANVWAEDYGGEHTEYTIHEMPDWDLTTVSVDALREWFMRKGMQLPAFFDMPEVRASGVPAYMDPVHPRYAPKLAAAVAAWLAVGDPNGLTPFQALSKWLTENNEKFGLLNPDGKPNRTGIEECAKVANWKPSGGSPKTPG
jgi:hypothetical protein